MKYILLIFLTVFSVAVIIASVLLFRFAAARPSGKHTGPKGETDDPLKQYRERINAASQWLEEKQPERVSIVSFDGLHLVGSYLPCEGAPAGTILLMHGYHSSGAGDFSCQIPFLHSLGFNLLIPDQRAHGESEGDYICFGVLERCDCRDWINYLNERNDGADIFLYGVSMGASTVMMSAGLELPDNVRGIIADCGFTSPYDIFRIIMRKWFHLPPFPVLQVAGIISKIVAGFGFREVSCAGALSAAKMPVMLIHGAADDFVPPEMTLENWRAIKSGRRLLFIDEAPHALSYLCDTPRYEAAVGEFLRDCTDRR